MISPNILEILAFLPGIIYLGLITFYTDVKYGKIKNRDIIFALVYTIIAYIALISFYSLRGMPVRIGYLFEVISNSTLALMLGFVLWHISLWSAADAKLFFAFSALLPLSVYKIGYIQYFPSLVLLLNTFFPFVLYAVPKIAFFTPLKDKKEQLKKFKLSDFLNMLLVFFILSWLINLASIYFKIKTNIFFSLLLAYLFVLLLQKIFKKYLVYILIFGVLIRIIFDYNSLVSKTFINQFSVFAIVIFSVYLISLFSAKLFTREINVKDIKAGNIIAERIYLNKKSRKYEKDDILQPREAEDAKKALKLEGYAEGLTESDAGKIMELFSKRRLNFSKIRIHQTLPFAPFIFLGVLLTLISRGSFVIFAGDLIGKFINKIQ